MRTRTTILAAGLLVAAWILPAAADWNPDPYGGGLAVAVGSISQTDAAILADGEGGTFIVFLNRYNGAVMAQHVDARGNPLWAANGITVGSSIASNGGPVPISDGAGGFLVFWITSGSTPTVRGQHVDAAGNVLWASSGTDVGTGLTLKQSVCAATDGAGGAFVGWCEASNIHGIIGDYIARVLRVDSGGTPVTTKVSLGSGPGDQENPALAADGSGGVIATWDDIRTGTQHIYAQHVNAAGTALWTAGGITICNAYGGQIDPVIVSDDAGGAVISWLDLRSYPTSYGIYAQRVTGGGSPLWTANGVSMCSATGARSGPVISTDGAGGAILAWSDSRGSDADIYAQHVTSAGSVSWGSAAHAVCTVTTMQAYPQIATDGAGGATITWFDQRNPLGGDIYAQRVSAAGGDLFATGGIPVCAASGSQELPAIGWDGAAVVVAWKDFRSGYVDLYAQRVDPFGYLGNPAPRITAAEDVPNDQGGRIKVSWEASYLDADPLYDIQDYEVFFRAGSTWLLAATVPSGPLPDYSATVETGASGTYSVYRIEARRYGAPTTVFWYSAPDSGVSLDNLAPLKPSGFAVESVAGAAQLTWDADREPDLAGYRLYRGAASDFVPSPANLLFDGSALEYVDLDPGSWTYALTAVDVHGNQSPPAIVESVSIGGVAHGFTLAAPNPNPTAGPATLRFVLPSPSHVRLDIYDVSGRRVRALDDAEFTAGTHDLTWDLRDDDGRKVPAGVFTARIVAGGAARARRLVVVP